MSNELKFNVGKTSPISEINFKDETYNYLKLNHNGEESYLMSPVYCVKYRPQTNITNLKTFEGVYGPYPETYYSKEKIANVDDYAWNYMKANNNEKFEEHFGPADQPLIKYHKYTVSSTRAVETKFNLLSDVVATNFWGATHLDSEFHLKPKSFPTTLEQYIVLFPAYLEVEWAKIYIEEWSKLLEKYVQKEFVGYGDFSYPPVNYYGMKIIDNNWHTLNFNPANNVRLKIVYPNFREAITSRLAFVQTYDVDPGYDMPQISSYSFNWETLVGKKVSYGDTGHFVFEVGVHSNTPWYEVSNSSNPNLFTAKEGSPLTLYIYFKENQPHVETKIRFNPIIVGQDRAL